MTMPEKITTRTQVEVYSTEYRYIASNFAGQVFHRKDGDGRYWVKPASGRCCRWLAELFKQSRPS